MGRNYSTTMEQRYCKKHPSHKQSNGVCPSCLREKLSQLSASSSSATTTNHSRSSTYSSLSPCSDDSNLSSPGSPLHKMAKTRSFSFLPKRSSRPVMEKSRSLAFVVEEKKKKKKGFWSKLFSGKRKEEDIRCCTARV